MEPYTCTLIVSQAWICLPSSYQLSSGKSKPFVARSLSLSLSVPMCHALESSQASMLAHLLAWKKPLINKNNLWNIYKTCTGAFIKKEKTQKEMLVKEAPSDCPCKLWRTTGLGLLPSFWVACHLLQCVRFKIGSDQGTCDVSHLCRPWGMRECTIAPFPEWMLSTCLWIYG